MKLKVVTVVEHMMFLRERAKRIGPEVFTWAQLAPMLLPPTKYGRYLVSCEWAVKRRAVLRRCNGICERCHESDVEHIHHRTYKRLYRECLTDLVGLCAACHAVVHGKVPPEDPADTSDA